MKEAVTKPKMVDVEKRDNQVYIHFIGEPIKPVKKALKDNGFKNQNSVYVAAITPSNRFFVKLLTGETI